jgi:hypothetical protein
MTLAALTARKEDHAVGELAGTEKGEVILLGDTAPELEHAGERVRQGRRDLGVLRAVLAVLVSDGRHRRCMASMTSNAPGVRSS